MRAKNDRPHFENGCSVIIVSPKNIAKFECPMLNAANYF